MYGVEQHVHQMPLDTFCPASFVQMLMSCFVYTLTMGA